MNGARSLAGERGEVLRAEGLEVGSRAAGTLLAGVNLTLRAGELAAVVGANGAGKTSLLRTLAGLQPARAGHVQWANRPLAQWPQAQRARLAAVVLTEAAADAGLTVAQLALLGRAPHRGPWAAPTAADRHAVSQALALAGVAPLATRRVGTLSDGQRQRARLARALAQDTPLLLLDEPTLHLDPAGRADLLALLRATAHGGRAVVVVTHEIELALAQADVLWVVQGGTVHALTAAQWQAEGWVERAFGRRGEDMSGYAR